jgi:hypothetical protein
VLFLFFQQFFSPSSGNKGIDKYPFLDARPGIITDALALVRAINDYEVGKSSFAPHVKLEPICQSFSSVSL